MNKLKGLVFSLVLGMLVGVAVTSFVAPGLVAWYNTPGGGQALCNCTDLVRSTIGALVQMQCVGGIIGGALFFIGRLLFGRGSKVAPVVTPPGAG